MNKIYKHLHPGEILKDIFERNDLTIAEAARQLKVTRLSISKLVNGHVGISSEMAIRLSVWLGNSIEFWIDLQASYDAWVATKRSKKIALKIKPLRAA
jgi:addiction module HigA family antidote